MNSKETVLSTMRALGKADALDLRGRAASMDATAIIAEEEKVPLFEWGKDYSSWPTGSPIGEIIDGELQIFTMITPVNTSNHPGITPNSERSLYNLCHTKDPTKAKPFVAPLGTSGLYMTDECCTDPKAEDVGAVYRSKIDSNPYAPSEYPDNWELVAEGREV